MATFIVSLIILAVVVLIAIPVLAAAFGQASRRDSNHLDSEGPEDQGIRTGSRRG